MSYIFVSTSSDPKNFINVPIEGLTIKDVKSTIHRLIGTSECNISCNKYIDLIDDQPIIDLMMSETNGLFFFAKLHQ